MYTKQQFMRRYERIKELESVVSDNSKKTEKKKKPRESK